MFPTLIKGKTLLILAFVLTMGFSVSAQKSLTRQPDPPVTFLDSTRKQDGLSGSVRRVKTQASKLEIKKGKLTEGPRQLLEITAYDLAGNRVDNVSYPVPAPTVGKEEYRYDKKGNVIELTLRDADGSLLSKQKYEYEFDKFGNWAKMVTYLVIFEGGELTAEPVEVTYRTLTYYFDDTVDKIINKEAGQSGSRKVSSRPASVSADDGPNVASKESPMRNESEAETKTRPGLPANPRIVNPDVTRSEGNSVVDLREPGITANSNNAGVPKKVTNPADSQAAPLAGSSSPAKVMGDKVGAPVNTSSRATPNRKAFDYYKLGHQRVESGDLMGAIEAYRKSIELGTDSAELQLSLGNVYIKLKKDGEAIKALKQSIRLYPESAEAHYGLGLVYFRANRFKDAETAFKKATVISPGMAKARYGLALTYQELGRLDALIEEYRKLQSLDKNLANQLSQSFPEFDLPCRVARCK